MKLIYLSTVLVSVFALSGCCTTKLVFSGDGNVTTGAVGGSVEVIACTPMEKEVANQINILSDWYRVEWRNCATNQNPTTCRTDVSKAYQEQKKTCLDLLAAMKGKQHDEQKALYENMLLKAKLLILK
jgi:hypothetical protein